MIKKSINRAIAVIFLAVASSLFGKEQFGATFKDIKTEFLNRAYWFLREDQLDTQLADKINTLQ